MTWKPNVTVAAVIEKDGRFLFVEENSGKQIVINQPAGHVEFGESFIQAVIRETLEETAYHFIPDTLIGIYYWHAQRKGITYLRLAYSGQITGHEPDRPLDEGILRTTWLTRHELVEQAARHRTPVVMRCLDDYIAGKRYPLDLITSFSEKP
ncbi:MAG: NUDIX hydrolase [Pseudomonadota bacterium]